MPDQPVILETSSPEETEQLGLRLARLLPPKSVVALRGELGTGKTCFVRGMAKHFTGANAVHSPTFTLVNEYGAGPKLYHIDLYRLTSLDEIADLGCAELFDSDALCAVEWAERAEALLPSQYLDVFLEHAGEDCRRVTITNHGVLAEKWAAELRD
ncbi:MAG: tRNA (adenosine(37)-N6)-threonylcarbamoyltransferase complex ATPase subunit type 1 TsaE [Candidatus Hydrogenedentes bacterium]|nr:tRNA (adenosine(37)-N6)-threonylcarbamoyltransferase complex ATPase subunit type 1 TsaE [Candidatus Hydrogenedentota bacterium]